MATSGSAESSENPNTLRMASIVMLPRARAQPRARDPGPAVRTAICMTRKVGLIAAPMANGSTCRNRVMSACMEG